MFFCQSVQSGPIVTSEQGAQLISTALENAPIAEILRQIQPAPNLLSQAEVAQLRDYVERLKRGESLSAGEARDFYRISDIVTLEYPGTQGSWLLFLIAGIVSGGIAFKK